MSAMQPSVPDWLLERFLLRELPPDELAAAEQRIAADPQAQARLAALRRSNEEILEAYEPGAMVARIAGRQRIEEAKAASAPPTGRRRSLLLAAPMLAGAMALLFVVVGDHGPVTQETRTKGQAQLVLVRSRAGTQEELQAADASARAGDLLQIAYRASEAAYGVILSVDGKGTVTTHFPGGPSAQPLARPGLQALPSAYELDAAPRFEIFFLVTAAAPFPVQEVQEAARDFARTAGAGEKVRHLALPAKFSQTSFVLRKE
jgi:anti-sigma factor RsiW